MICQPYVRTSTDDKGQNPERQLTLIRRWAEQEGVTLLDPVIDEGSSASKDEPFARPLFVKACERAAAANADALVLEVPDRLTRLDLDAFGWTRYELAKRYGLRVVFSAYPLDLQHHMIGRLLAAMQVESGHEWVKLHTERVVSGMEEAKKKGVKFGRPKVELTDAELEHVHKLREDGKGWPTCAEEISRMRGAYDVLDAKLRRQRTVSHPTVKKRYAEWIENKTPLETSGGR